MWHAVTGDGKILEFLEDIRLGGDVVFLASNFTRIAIEQNDCDSYR